jgi:RNA polymerase sigma factor (sigma-70 family)
MRVILLWFCICAWISSSEGVSPGDDSVFLIRGHAELPLKDFVKKRIRAQLEILSKEHAIDLQVLEKSLAAASPTLYETILLDLRTQTKTGLETFSEPEWVERHLEEVDAVVRGLIQKIFAKGPDFPDLKLLDDFHGIRPLLTDSLVGISFQDFLVLVRSSMERVLSRLEATVRDRFYSTHSFGLVVEQSVDYLWFQFYRGKENTLVTPGRFRANLDVWVSQVLSDIRAKNTNAPGQLVFYADASHLYPGSIRQGYDHLFTLAPKIQMDFLVEAHANMTSTLRKLLPNPTTLNPSSLQRAEFSPQFLRAEFFFESLKWALTGGPIEKPNVSELTEKVALSFRARLSEFEPSLVPPSVTERKTIAPLSPIPTTVEETKTIKRVRRPYTKTEKFIVKAIANVETVVQRLAPHYGVTFLDFWTNYSDSSVLEALGYKLQAWRSIPLGDFSRRYEAQAFCERALRPLFEKLAQKLSVPFPRGDLDSVDSERKDRIALFGRLPVDEKSKLESLWSVAPVSKRHRAALRIYIKEQNPLLWGFDAEKTNTLRVGANDAFDIFIGFREWLKIAPQVIARGERAQGKIFELKSHLEALALTYLLETSETTFTTALQLLEKLFSAERKISEDRWKIIIDRAAREALGNQLRLVASHNPFLARRAKPSNYQGTPGPLVLKPEELPITDQQWKDILLILDRSVEDLATEFELKTEEFWRLEAIPGRDQGRFSQSDFFEAMREEVGLWQKRRLGREMPLRGQEMDLEEIKFRGTEIQIITANVVRALWARLFHEKNQSLFADWRTRKNLSRASTVALIPRNQFDRVLWAWAMQETPSGRVTTSSEGDIVQTRVERFRDVYVHNLLQGRLGEKRLNQLYPKSTQTNWDSILTVDFETFMAMEEKLRTTPSYFLHARPHKGAEANYLILWARLQKAIDDKVTDLLGAHFFDTLPQLIPLDSFAQFVDATYAVGPLPENHAMAMRAVEKLAVNFLNLNLPRQLRIESRKDDRKSEDWIHFPEQPFIQTTDWILLLRAVDEIVEQRLALSYLPHRPFWRDQEGRFTRQEVITAMADLAEKWKQRGYPFPQNNRQIQWLAKASIDQLLSTIPRGEHLASPIDWNAEIASGATDRAALVHSIAETQLRNYVETAVSERFQQLERADQLGEEDPITYLTERFMDAYYFQAPPEWLTARFGEVQESLKSVFDRVAILQKHPPFTPEDSPEKKKKRQNTVVTGMRLIIEQAKTRLEDLVDKEIATYRVPQLAQRIKEGDKAAFEELVLSYLPLVAKIARKEKYQDQGLSDLELFSGGIMGLLEAAERFDPTIGAGFGKYAHYWIREGIRQEFIKLSLFKGATNIYKLNRRWDAAASEAALENSRPPRDADVETVLTRDNPVAPKHFDRMRQARAASTQLGTGEEEADSETMSALTTVVDPLAKDTGKTVADCDWIRSRLNVLQPQARFIVQAAYGIQCAGPLTFADTEQIFNYSRKEALRELLDPKVDYDLFEAFFRDSATVSREPDFHLRIAERIDQINARLGIIYRLRFGVALPKMNDKQIGGLMKFTKEHIQRLRTGAEREMAAPLIEQECPSLVAHAVEPQEIGAFSETTGSELAPATFSAEK